MAYLTNFWVCSIKMFKIIPVWVGSEYLKHVSIFPVRTMKKVNFGIFGVEPDEKHNFPFLKYLHDKWPIKPLSAEAKYI